MADELEFRLLRYFVVVAEELHFSRAAQRLFVAQRAVSRDIRRLEERLGVRLLDPGHQLGATPPQQDGAPRLGSIIHFLRPGALGHGSW